MIAESSILSALLLAGTAVHAYPAPSPLQFIQQAPNPGVVIQKCSAPGMLALAYDDGPYQYTSALVDILDQGGAKGTFFWTGTLYGCIYNQAAAIAKTFASGHQIASHTWYVAVVCLILTPFFSLPMCSSTTRTDRRD